MIDLGSPRSIRHDGENCTVSVVENEIWVEAASVGLVELTWPIEVAPASLVLGDAWERSYGDLQWSRLDPSRVMPWYLLVTDGNQTTGFGVETGASAMCSWRLTGSELILNLDLRSGQRPVRLGGRSLRAAKVVSVGGEAPFETAQELCRQMCSDPMSVSAPVYGVNDWYYAYGKNTAERLVADSALASGWAGTHPNRPFCVIDDGWQLQSPSETGPWTGGNEAYGDMEKLASRIRSEGCRPGIWMRPLYVNHKVPDAWRIHDKALDPSVPEVLEVIHADVRRLHDWGYDLIKHDFTTWEACGLWGFEMTNGPYSTDRTFHDDTRTTAEILLDLYRAIRAAAGDSLLIGCNTVAHLAAGLHEIQRIGDDTSGKDWSRTRKMGVNTLAFRAAQHGTMFQADADCVGLTKDIPWELDRQWLQLVAQSGTPLFVSADVDALGCEQHQALKEAFAAAAEPGSVAEPLDWLETKTPTRWRLQGQEVTFDWGLG